MDDQSEERMTDEDYIKDLSINYRRPVCNKISDLIGNHIAEIGRQTDDLMIQGFKVRENEKELAEIEGRVLELGRTSDRLELLRRQLINEFSNR
jgi:hypothetical protein